MTNLLFEPPFGGLRGNVRTSYIAPWKECGWLPIRDNWTFFAISYGWDVISWYWSKSAYFRGGWVTLSANFKCEGMSPQPLLIWETYSVFATSQWRPRDSIFIRQHRVPECDGQTDGRNCRWYYSALHYKQCGRAVKTTAATRLWCLYFGIEKEFWQLTTCNKATMSQVYITLD